MITPLNRTTITEARPNPIRILQFGGGNFLRAFAGWMVEVLNEETGFSSDIVIVKPTAGGSYGDLKEQQGLYHVVLQGIRDGIPVTEIKRIHCVRKVLSPYEDWENYLKLAESPSICLIVSNTTEAGIVYNPAARADECPPQGFPAKLAVWLYHRFRHFGGDPAKGCVILPCELIEDNGRKLLGYIRQHAVAWQLDQGFTDWVNQANFFCNTLVDRIVSGYPADLAAGLHKELGYQDKLLVAGEYYHSWIIQGPDFLPERLPVTRTPLNIRFVDDLNPYRTMKVRILNGAHTMMVPVGYLLGLRYVHECLQDPGMKAYLEALLRDEICPVIDFPGLDTTAYGKEVFARFQNPYIKHELVSIALNAMPKFVTRVLPTIADYDQRYHQAPKRIIFSLAALICFYKGAVNGEYIPLKDDRVTLEFFRGLWAGYSPSPENALELVKQVLNFEHIWGTSATILQGSAKQLADYVYLIETMGMKEAMRNLEAN